MLGPPSPTAPPRFSVSMLPVDADPAERDFVRLLERALSPSFALVRRLGAGGMGSVYLARDPVLKRLVAVKVMAPALAADHNARARFEREAQAVASISHPNVVAVYSVGTLENGVPYLVMQYVEGSTVEERVRRGGPLDAATARRVLGEVASALAAAHRKGIVHRDIKPSNILLDDESGRALVSDFGIAAVRQESEARDVKLTMTGASVGTPAYMSPEQVLGEPVTEKTDVYSLGVLGYELLTGEGPYQISKPGEVMAAHLRDVPRKLSGVRADVDPEVERLLEDCLTKEPERRPSAAEAQDRLMHGASVLLEWPPPGLEHLAARFRRALRPTALGAGLLGVPLVLMSVLERGGYWRSLLPPVEFLIAFATLGTLIFLAGCARLIDFLKAAGKCADTGYRWGTIAETVADQRGDSGALIAGGREYATLPPARRSVLRRNRIAAMALLLAAAFTPLLGFAAGVIAGARSENGPAVALWSSLILAVLLMTASALLVSYENRSLRAARARRLALGSVRERPTELAAAWTDTFNQVRAGQRLGPGPTGGLRRAWYTASAVIAGAVVVAVGAQVFLFFTGIFTVVGEVAVPSFDRARDRVLSVQRLRAYRVPPDSTISALRAGQALYSIARTTSASSDRWLATPPVVIPPHSPGEPVTFGSERADLADAFRVARRGFTDEQRRYLRALAENPALPEFRLAANAPRLDLGAAMYDIQPGSRVSALELPVLRLAAVRSAALSNTAAAALNLAAGQRLDAERRLREVIGVGFLLMDDGRLLIENMVGAAMVRSARGSLEALYEVTGREREARFVSAASDPSLDASPGLVAGRRRMPLDEMMHHMRRIVLDTAAIRGLRWEMLMSSSIAICSDPRQVLFGPDLEHEAFMDSARVRLVRSASDSVVFSLFEQPMGAPRMTRDGAPLTRPPATWMGRLGTAITGHRVLEYCAGILLGASG